VSGIKVFGHRSDFFTGMNTFISSSVFYSRQIVCFTDAKDLTFFVIDNIPQYVKP